MNCRMLFFSVIVVVLLEFVVWFGFVVVLQGIILVGYLLYVFWQVWKILCLIDDGCVVDGFQNLVSYFEGQGYGLMLVVIFDDCLVFDIIMEWSDCNFVICDDVLMVWCWWFDMVLNV